MYVWVAGPLACERQDGKQMQGKCEGNVQDKAHGMEMVKFCQSGVFLLVK